MAFIGSLSAGMLQRPAPSRCTTTTKSQIHMTSKNADMHKPQLSRRDLLQSMAILATGLVLTPTTPLPASAAAIQDVSKAKALIKSYGLAEPQVPSGFTLVADSIQENQYVLFFLHPSGWLLQEEVPLTVDRPRLESARPKTKCLVKASDFRKAEEVGVFVFDDVDYKGKKVKDLDWREEIAKNVVTAGATDLKLRKRQAVNEDRDYFELGFTTITDAAYAFERRAVLTAEVFDGKLFVCAAQANTPRFVKGMGEKLQTSVSSFQVAKILKT